MLSKFKSKNAGDVIMLEPVGKHVLEAIGKSPDARGIILAADIPAAISALQAAIAKEEIASKSEGVEPLDGPGLRQRAVPFIDMLRRNQRSGDDVVWGV